MSSDASIQTKKDSATAAFMLSKKTFMEALELVSETWSGYRHYLAKGDYDAARAYIADMPECSSKIFAQKNIEFTQKQNFEKSVFHNETPEITPLNEEITDQQKADVVENLLSARAVHFSALNGLTDAWTGVVNLIESGAYEKAHEYLSDMPDSTAKTVLVCQVLDAEAETPPSCAPGF